MEDSPTKKRKDIPSGTDHYGQYPPSYGHPPQPHHHPYGGHPPPPPPPAAYRYHPQHHLPTHQPPPPPHYYPSGPPPHHHHAPIPPPPHHRSHGSPPSGPMYPKSSSGQPPWMASGGGGGGSSQYGRSSSQARSVSTDSKSVRSEHGKGSSGGGGSGGGSGGGGASISSKPHSNPKPQSTSIKNENNKTDSSMQTGSGGADAAGRWGHQNAYHAGVGSGLYASAHPPPPNMWRTASARGSPTGSIRSNRMFPSGVKQESDDIDDKGRGSYKCGKCGVPKKGHVCPYQPKFNRRPDEPPPEMKSASTQVEMDEFLVLRRLNLEIQGLPESYTSEPMGNVGAEPHPIASSPHHQQQLPPPSNMSRGPPGPMMGMGPSGPPPTGISTQISSSHREPIQSNVSGHNGHMGIREMNPSYPPVSLQGADRMMMSDRK